MSDPRLFGIIASAADVVAVIRRGPSGWCHVGRWETAQCTYEPGAWVHATLYPQRCDLSPDGRYFSAFVLGPVRDGAWAPGNTYVSISRLPWLTSLVAWGTGGTWSRGVAFADRSVWEVSEPDAGDAGPLRERLGLVVNAGAAFAVERRRGWVETRDSPPRAPDDLWDERRGDRLRMEKLRADGKARLVVSGRYAAFRRGQPAACGYWLDIGGGEAPLAGVQWAEFAADGSLLVATASGELQKRNAFEPDTPLWSADLSILVPAPAPPPPEAHQW